MTQTLVSVCLMLLVAIGGGAGSVWWMTGEKSRVGAVRAAEWTAYPDLGFPDADPYSRAKVAREGRLALGRAEGIAFVADRDLAGAVLRRECDYRIEGNFPVARFWTMMAATPDGRPLPAGVSRPAAQSRQLLRQADGSIRIEASRAATPGNWLGIGGKGPLAFVLTLYDTSIANGENVADLDLPRIQRLRCDA